LASVCKVSLDRNLGGSRNVLLCYSLQLHNIPQPPWIAVCALVRLI
jgi:hypothetical protein